MKKTRMDHRLLVRRKLLQRFFHCFLFSSCLKSNYLKFRIEPGFFDIFSSNIYCIITCITEPIRTTNFATSFGATKCLKVKTVFEAAEMILDP